MSHYDFGIKSDNEPFTLNQVCWNWETSQTCRTGCPQDPDWEVIMAWTFLLTGIALSCMYLLGVKPCHNSCQLRALICVAQHGHSVSSGGKSSKARWYWMELGIVLRELDMTSGLLIILFQTALLMDLSVVLTYFYPLTYIISLLKMPGPDSAAAIIFLIWCFDERIEKWPIKKKKGVQLGGDDWRLQRNSTWFTHLVISFIHYFTSISGEQSSSRSSTSTQSNFVTLTFKLLRSSWPKLTAEDKAPLK